MGIEENQELNAREAWDREYQKASLRDSNFETMNNNEFQFDLCGSQPGSRAADLAFDRSYQYAAGTAQ